MGNTVNLGQLTHNQPFFAGVLTFYDDTLIITQGGNKGVYIPNKPATLFEDVRVTRC